MKYTVHVLILKKQLLHKSTKIKITIKLDCSDENLLQKHLRNFLEKETPIAQSQRPNMDKKT